MAPPFREVWEARIRAMRKTHPAKTLENPQNSAIRSAGSFYRWEAGDQAAQKLPSRQSNWRLREANSEQVDDSCHVGIKSGSAVSPCRNSPPDLIDRAEPRCLASALISEIGRRFGPFMEDVDDRLRDVVRTGFTSDQSPR